jgi:hypothetical protein
MKTDRTIIVSQYVQEEVRLFKESKKTPPSRKDIDKFKRKSELEVKGHEAYLNFVIKLNERLTLIAGCVRDNLEIPEPDIMILEELHILYDSDRLHWITKKVEDQEHAVQQVLFVDELVKKSDILQLT